LKTKKRHHSPSRTSSLFLLPFVIMNIISQKNIAYSGEDKTEQEKIPKYTLPCHTKRKKNDLVASIMMMWRIMMMMMMKMGKGVNDW